MYDAFAHLYHYESRSRGYEDSPQKQARLAREAEYMKNKWKHVMGSDPYYNRNLSLKNGYYCHKAGWYQTRKEKQWNIVLIRYL